MHAPLEECGDEEDRSELRELARRLLEEGSCIDLRGLKRREAQ